MDLLPDESTILVSRNKTLTLTTHRIRKTAKTSEGTHIYSVMLEAVSSCEGHYKSNIWLLVLGIVIAIASIILGLTFEPFAYAGILITVLFIVLFYLGQRAVLLILSSGGGRIVTDFKTYDEISSFIDAVESAKNHRYLRLKDSRQANLFS